VVFVFNSDEAQYLPIVRTMFPGGEERPMDSVSGPLARTYTVGASEAAQRYGVKLTLDDGRQGWEGQVQALGALPDGGTSVTYPLTATWSGAFYLDRAGVGRLHAQEPVSLTLRVGGEPAAPDGDMMLDAGWIPFEAQAVLEDARPLHIVLQQGTEAAREIPQERLWPLEPRMGLAATFSGATMQHRVDPFIGSGVLRSESRLLGQDPDLLSMIPAGTQRPRAVWEGDLYAEGGTYTMELRTDAHARLSIDSRTVLDLCDNPAVDPLIPIRGNIPPVTSTVTLAEGWHPVRLEYEASGNINGLEWTWTRPDGTREIVPPSRLRYALPGALGAPVHWPDPPGPVTCSP
jgi:hypothetical protein